jgi:hypothetical protein
MAACVRVCTACVHALSRSQSSHHEYVRTCMNGCMCACVHGMRACAVSIDHARLSPCGRQTHSTEVPASVLPPTQAERLTSTSTTHTLPMQQRAAPCQRPVGCARSEASPTCTCMCQINPALSQSVSQCILGSNWVRPLTFGEPQTSTYGLRTFVIRDGRDRDVSSSSCARSMCPWRVERCS